MRDFIGKRPVKAALCALFWLALWQLASALVGQELILPSPLAAARSLVSLAGRGIFWRSAGLSLLRVFGGFAAGALLGAALAAGTEFSPLLDTLLSPAIRVLRATPVASFIILALLWLGHSLVPAFIAALMVLPVVWGQTAAALRETPGELLELAGAYRFGRAGTLRLVYIPSVLPAFRAACLTGMGLAWKAGVAAEVLALPREALGTHIYYSKIYLETPELFAWTAAVAALSLALEKLFALLLRGRRGG